MNRRMALIVADSTTETAQLAATVASAGFTPQRVTPDVAAHKACECAFVVLAPSSDISAQEALRLCKLKLEACLVPTISCAQPVEAPRVSEMTFEPDATSTPAQLADQIPSLLAEHEKSRRRHLRCDLRITLPNDCKWIDPLNAALHELYAQLKFERETVHRLTMAVREMVHNAVEWGNRGQANATVAVRCIIDDQKVIIRVQDAGQGFNPTKLPHAASSQDPTQHLNVRDALGLRAGGFGILMTRGLVDELTYNEVGNEVQIVKRLNAPGPK